jgi:hypothetical protein
MGDVVSSKTATLGRGAVADVGGCSDQSERPVRVQLRDSDVVRGGGAAAR